MRAVAAMSFFLLAFPAASATPPAVAIAVDSDPTPLPLGEERAFQVDVTFTCGTPPDPTTHVDLDLASGNYFNMSADRIHWVHSGADCAQAGGTLHDHATGTVRLVRAMPPFQELSFRILASLGDGDATWTADAEDLRVVPDAWLSVGAVLGTPANVTKGGGTLRQDAVWTVTNHGTGAFHADVRVDSKPPWLDLDVPDAIDSNDAESGATATFTMRATMPASCPAASAVVVLEFAARSPDARSHASSNPKVQGVVPCAPAKARGTPAVEPGLLAVALLAARGMASRGPARQQKR
ncbi:MAG: hypothetical protein ABR562_04245 [Thermoplasmatota archaeon]